MTTIDKGPASRPAAGSAKPAAVLVALIVAIVVGGCPPSTPPTPPPPPVPPILDFPAAFRVQGSGTVDIGDITLPGNVRMDYLVYPSGRVVVSQLDAWIGDLDIVVTFLWWETDRERLRCNRISNVDPIVGRLTGDRIDFASASSSFVGLSFDQRDSAGDCPGLARQVEVTNDGPFSLIHDPDRRRSELTASFTATYAGNTVPLAFRLTGRFLNRPPVAAIGVGPPGTPWQRIEGGCPTGPQGKLVLAPNHADGLVLDLRSFSYDDDSRASERFDIKFPRGDISTEQWGHSTGGKYAYLGEGRLLGPVLFRTGMRHALLLTVTDRTGAKARQVCVFQVAVL